MNVLVLTGAGISAESGIPTFRDSNGLWRGYRPEEVATPEAFAREPELVYQFYNERRRKLLDALVEPNAAHHALAKFEEQHTGNFLLITQNVDDLHQRAGSQNVLPMHGEILKARCLETGSVVPWRADLERHSRSSDAPGQLRPHIVWFGEQPFGLEKISQAAANADLFVAIGTSAVVYPAAGIVNCTQKSCRTVEINTVDTPQSDAFGESLRGLASEQVPQFFSGLMTR
ncbi:MAG: NAD-dependent deacylase [Aureliella sp.]